jgi:hypothetical protein
MIPITLGFTKDAEFKAVQSTLACQGVLVAVSRTDNTEQRIMTPILMIVEILIALAYSEYPLLEQLLERKRYALRIAMVNAAVRECSDKVSLFFNLAQEQQSTVAGGSFSIVPDDYFPTFWTLHAELELLTLCSHTRGSFLLYICLWQTDYTIETGSLVPFS